VSAFLSSVTDPATDDVGVAKVDMKLEVVTIPVSDVERATAFYRRVEWRQDVTPTGSGIVQFTPPASGCSIQFGRDRASATPGPAEGLYLIVSDVVAARKSLVAADIEVSEVFHRHPAAVTRRGNQWLHTHPTLVTHSA
jgi:catechol 2,3-dioxygenase-like lactoylglutathione lyase family enzyme